MSDTKKPELPLLPCPFCGGTDIDLDANVVCGDDGEYPVAGCRTCDCTGPKGSVPDDLWYAAYAWNQRAEAVDQSSRAAMSVADSR